VYREGNAGIGQRRHRGFGHDILARFEDLPGKPTEQEAKTSQPRLLVGKCDNNHRMPPSGFLS
jgi:hypothetical protein